MRKSFSRALALSLALAALAAAAPFTALASSGGPGGP